MTIINVILLILVSAFIGYLIGINHKATQHDVPKDSIEGSLKDVKAVVYYKHLLDRIYQKSHKCWFDLSQAQRECLKGYALRATQEHIRTTDIRTQLVIKSMCH